MCILPHTGTHALPRTGTHTLSCTHAPSLIVITAVEEAQPLCAACFLATLRKEGEAMMTSTAQASSQKLTECRAT